MSEKEYYAEHIETGLVYAEDEEEAYNKAVGGESETGWNTKELTVEEVTEDDFESRERLEIVINGKVSTEKSEKLEDLIAEKLENTHLFDERGKVRSEVTGNEVSFNV